MRQVKQRPPFETLSYLIFLLLFNALLIYELWNEVCGGRFGH